MKSRSMEKLRQAETERIAREEVERRKKAIAIAAARANPNTRQQRT